MEETLSQLYQREIESCTQNDAKTEMMSMMCQPCEGETLTKWKRVLGHCNECHKYQIQSEEQEPVHVGVPDVLFCVYK